MFDRPPPSKPVAQAADASPDGADSVERLCRLYDARLTAAGGRLSPDDARDLKAMAGLYGLDADRPATEVWRDLRRVIVGQTAGPADAAPRPAETAVVGADLEPLTLLVVEDDAEVAADLTELLTEAGHRVVGPFHSAAAAEAAAALHAIDGALLDINLSGDTTGGELAEVLTRRWDVRVIFISGDADAAARYAPLAEALVLKPYTGPQILAAVGRLGRPG
ncbi:MAG: response regulator [Brevundimonas sp.]